MALILMRSFRRKDHRGKYYSNGCLKKLIINKTEMSGWNYGNKHPENDSIRRKTVQQCNEMAKTVLKTNFIKCNS